MAISQKFLIVCHTEDWYTPIHVQYEKNIFNIEAQVAKQSSASACFLSRLRLQQKYLATQLRILGLNYWKKNSFFVFIRFGTKDDSCWLIKSRDVINFDCLRQRTPQIFLAFFYFLSTVKAVSYNNFYQILLCDVVSAVRGDVLK